ncbi:unnamed protein product [Ixodes pacificus]
MGNVRQSIGHCSTKTPFVSPFTQERLLVLWNTETCILLMPRAKLLFELVATATRNISPITVGRKQMQTSTEHQSRPKPRKVAKANGASSQPPYATNVNSDNN